MAMRFWSVSLLALVLTACGSSSGPATPAGGGSTPPGAARTGVSTDMIIPSNVDGEAISITIHEPTQFVEGQKYPLILEGHGYGGSKISAAERPAAGDTGTFGRLLDAGYGIISIDQRGFGESGGTVRLFDPEFEGRDLVQIVDWAEENLDWLAYRNDNLLLGAIGGSYGGGYQHSLYALDPKKRLDAIAPEITWHDLRYSLFSNNVFKSYWATLLSAAGNVAGRQDMQINQALVRGLTTNSISETDLDLLYRVSLISHCEGNNPDTAGGALTRIDALYWQSARDTLFNMNDQIHNVQCLRALGGDVRMLTKTNGHDAGDGETCGALKKSQSIVDWYDEKLKGMAGKASYIPQHCFTLGETGADGVVTSSIPVGGQSFQFPAQSVTALGVSPQPPTSVLLTQIGAGGAVLAGIPTIDMTVTGTPALDPILFMGIAVRRAGTTTDTLVMGNQVAPYRGYGNHTGELVGLNVRLAANDEVRLLIHPAFSSRYPSTGSTLPAPVTVEGTVNLPLLSATLPAPPAN